MRSKILMGVAIIAATVVIGVGIGYWAGGGSGAVAPVAVQTPGPSPAAGGQESSGTPDSQPVMSQNVAAAVSNLQPQPAPAVQTNDITQATTNPPAASTNWEDTVDDIVGSDDADTNKVKQLFALFPTLPPDGKEEVAQHLSNLVEDDNYGPLGALLKDDTQPPGVLDELMSDVLNRPNTLKLPMLLDVAQDSNNPEHDEAKDLLELYVGQDVSGDWSQAGNVVTNWLQQNPD